MVGFPFETNITEVSHWRITIYTTGVRGPNEPIDRTLQLMCMAPSTNMRRNYNCNIIDRSFVQMMYTFWFFLVWFGLVWFGSQMAYTHINAQMAELLMMVLNSNNCSICSCSSSSGCCCCFCLSNNKHNNNNIIKVCKIINISHEIMKQWWQDDETDDEESK